MSYSPQQALIFDRAIMAFLSSEATTLADPKALSDKFGGRELFKQGGNLVEFAQVTPDDMRYDPMVAFSVPTTNEYLSTKSDFHDGVDRLLPANLPGGLNNKYGLDDSRFAVFGVKGVLGKEQREHVKAPEVMLITQKEARRELARQLLEKLADPRKALPILGMDSTDEYKEALNAEDSKLSQQLQAIAQNGAFTKNDPDLEAIMSSASQKGVENYEFAARIKKISTALPAKILGAYTQAEQARSDRVPDRF